MAKDAAKLAMGPMVAKIGSRAMNDKKERKRHKELARELLMENDLNQDVSEELTDMEKLLRYKTFMSWLPPMTSVFEEMNDVLDEQKVSVHHRRATYNDAMVWSLQHMERMMFSLTEFLLWQEEGFTASWTMEEAAQIAPASRPNYMIIHIILLIIILIVIIMIIIIHICICICIYIYIYVHICIGRSFRSGPARWTTTPARRATRRTVSVHCLTYSILYYNTI